MRTADKKSIYAIILAFAMLVSVLFSFEVIPAHSGHSCHEESCPICRMLDAATQTINSLKAVVCFAAVIVISCTLVQALKEDYSFFFRSDTLITQKVELLD